jgi:hypothetical protein
MAPNKPCSMVVQTTISPWQRRLCAGHFDDRVATTHEPRARRSHSALRSAMAFEPPTDYPFIVSKVSRDVSAHREPRESERPAVMS